MRLKNEKKLITVVILVSVLLILDGWGKKKIDLMTDGKLINLDKAIVMAQLGTEEKNQNTDSNKKDVEEESEQDQATVDVSVVSSRTYKIRIHGTRIALNGTECKKEELASLIREKCQPGDSVRLLDDYAEAHVYHEVEDILTELSKSIGFKYDAE